MTEGYGWKKDHSEMMKLDFIDVRRAYFHAVVTRDVYVELPPEDYEEGMCGKLLKSMYGTRDAAQNWEHAYTEFMEKAGFKRGIASPCVFWNEEKNIRAVIHGDDFTMLGWEKDLDWFRKQIVKTFEVKMRGRMGRDAGDDKHMRILNRIVTWTNEGIEYEPDQRHAEIIIKMMGLDKSEKSVITPGTKWDGKFGEGEEDSLSKEEATNYRAMAARANYLSQDRSDIRQAVKEISRRMANPRVRDVQMIKRLARYLVGRPRVISIFEKQRFHKELIGWSDSDWAGCTETRKSTSGGVIQWGTHTLKTWSTTQNIISMSSAEAEYYALVKTGSQSLGMAAIGRDMGIKVGIKLKTDASAAQGIGMRKGLGQLRHLETNQLWIQDRIHKGDISLEKVEGKKNIADALTKYADGEMNEVHREGCRIIVRGGRHVLAPECVELEMHA